MSRDSAIERRAKSIEVGPWPLQAGICCVLLERRVPRFDNAGQHAAPSCYSPPCRAEVEEHRTAVRAPNDVVRSNVAMQKVLRMHYFNRIEQRSRDPIQLFLRW